MKKISHIMVVASLMCFLIAGCNDGGGGNDGLASFFLLNAMDGSSPGDNGGDTDGTTNPVFTGFNFSLSTNTFWEYEWDSYEYTYAMGSSPETVRDTGRFWVVLGAARQIQGITAYEVKLFGKTRIYDSFASITPRWNYLAVSGNKMLGSTNGTTLQTIFDGNTGKWVGGGFFVTFPSDKLTIASNSTISNDHISSTAAIKVGTSGNKSQCEYFPGYGSICGDESLDYQTYEYYKGGVGVLGYYHYMTASYSGGGYYSDHTAEYNIGLTASSLTGDILPLLPEVEPNNAATISGSQLITIPSAIRGDCMVNDSTYHATYSILSPPDIYVEDVYRFTLASQANVKISLAFEGYTTADLDVFLFNNNATPAVISAGTTDNPADNYPHELIWVTLSAGTYYVGVDSYATPNGRVNYTLQVEITP